MCKKQRLQVLYREISVAQNAKLIAEEKKKIGYNVNTKVTTEKLEFLATKEAHLSSTRKEYPIEPPTACSSMIL